MLHQGGPARKRHHLLQGHILSFALSSSRLRQQSVLLNIFRGNQTNVLSFLALTELTIQGSYKPRESVFPTSSWGYEDG